MSTAGVEHDAATYGTKVIPYRIERSQRRVSVAVIVDPADGVVMRVPKALDRDRIAAVVRRKGPWIVRRLRGLEDLLPAPSAREFVSGESFLYLGRQHRLRVEAGSGVDKARVALERGRLLVQVPPGLGDEDRAAVVRAALKVWYREKARAYLPARLERWAVKVGVAAPKLLLREPPKRWGSCDASGNVRINWRTIQVAPRLVDYVIAHELVHLKHRDHGGEFWATLGGVLHDAEARRDALRRIGPRVNW